MPETVIRIHASAPRKPDWGQPCNGCGVCCLMEPCPLGVVLSRRRQGACVAVGWDGSRYQCDALARPATVLAGVLPRWTGRWHARLAPLLSRVARRTIAPGIGCDCDAQA